MLTGQHLVPEGSLVVLISPARSNRSKRDFRIKLLTTAGLKGSLLILGKGYTGGGLASHLQQDEDWQVTLTLKLNSRCDNK